MQNVKAVQRIRIGNIGDVIAAAVLLACLSFLGIFLFNYFPRETTVIRSYPLLPGKHTLVSSILDGDVGVNGDQFLEVAKGHQTFVAASYAAITYLVKVEGVSYRYDQHTDGPGSPRYYEAYTKAQIGTQVTNRSNEEGYISPKVLVREFHRDTGAVILLLLIVPAIVALLLGWAMSTLKPIRMRM